MKRSCIALAALVLSAIAGCQSTKQMDPDRGGAWPGVLCPPDTGLRTAEELIMEIQMHATEAEQPMVVDACTQALQPEPPPRQDPANWPMMTQHVLDAHNLLPMAMGGSPEAWNDIAAQLNAIP